MEVIEVPSSSVFLGEEQHYTRDDWLNLPRYYETPIECKVLYNDELYSATVLQIILAKVDMSDCVRRLRDLVFLKKKKIPYLLSAVIRVNAATRNRFPNFNTIETSACESAASESEAEEVTKQKQKQMRQCQANAEEEDGNEEAPSLVPPPSASGLSTPIATLSRSTVCDASSTVAKHPACETGQCTPANPLPRAATGSRASDTELSLSRSLHASQLGHYEDLVKSKTGHSFESKAGRACMQMATLRHACAIDDRLGRLEKNLLPRLMSMVEQLTTQVAALEIQNRQLLRNRGTAQQETEDPRRTNLTPIDSWAEYAAFITSKAVQDRLMPHLRGCRSGTVHDTLKRMIEKCLSTKMQLCVNFSGRGMQQRSQLDLSDVKLGFRNALPLFQDITKRPSEREVELGIMTVLKHAADREAAKQRRRQTLPAASTAACGEDQPARCEKRIRPDSSSDEENV
uniref:BEN domain-containing protein n=2 Tax=Macrostomum lignano TaxID=282301 RepID=A0A1I8GZF0_9PLAT